MKDNLYKASYLSLIMIKRGLSHIEVVLAFIIFIVAISFALFLFSPTNSNRLVESSLTYSFIEILDKVTIDVETYTLIFEDIPDKDLPGNGIVKIKISGTEERENVQISNKDGAIISSKKLPNDKFINIEYPGEGIYFIKYGEDYEEGDIPGGGLIDERFYTIASSYIEDIVSEEKFLGLVKAYNDNYLGLKGEDGFNLPNRVHFSFKLVFKNPSDPNNPEVIEPNNPDAFFDENTDVFIDTKRVEVLRNDLLETIEFADLTVTIW